MLNCIFNPLEVVRHRHIKKVKVTLHYLFAVNSIQITDNVTIFLIYFQIHFFVYHTIFKNIPKNEWDHSQEIVILDINEHVFWLELQIIPQLWTVTKAVIVTKRDKYRNS